MDFRLDDGQIELQSTVDRFCADRFPLDAVGRREGETTDRAVWAELARLGVFGLLLPEDAGGSGMSPVEAAIVFEQLGSHLAPGPVLWTLLAAPYVDGAATGVQLVSGVDATGIEGGVALVEHAAEVDVILVTDEHLVCHPVAELEPPRPVTPLDPLTPVARVEGLTAGRVVGNAEAADHVRALGMLLDAALLVGVASRALEVARSYALERHQFGVPIGSFQAVKHLLADMYVRSALAQSAMYAAAAVYADSGRVAASRAVAGADLLAAEAAIANASAAIQVLGGMGFTWDMLPNYLLKRAWVLEQSFTTTDEHARGLGTALAMSASRGGR